MVATLVLELSWFQLEEYRLLARLGDVADALLCALDDMIVFVEAIPELLDLLLLELVLLPLLGFQMEVMSRWLLRKLCFPENLVVEKQRVDLVLLRAVTRLVGVTLLRQLLLILLKGCAVHPRTSLSGFHFAGEAHLLPNGHLITGPMVLDLHRESKIS